MAKIFTPQARDLLKKLEGCRLTAYADQAGVWTIGYGSTGPDIREGLVWTQEQADAALSKDLSDFILGVSKLVGQVPLSNNQFSALVIFAYNVGLHALAGSLALKYTLQSKLNLVPDALMLWNKIHGPNGLAVNPGLTKRRQAEISLWRTPDT